MNNIPFPKLYEFLESSPYTKMHSKFLDLFDSVATIGCLLIDGFIDKGIFGDDWEEFFLQLINEMTEAVLYDPSKIEEIECEDAQEYFQLLYSSTLCTQLCNLGGITFEDLKPNV